MLNKLLAGCALVAFGVVISSQAKAECNGIYLAGRGGIANPKIADKDANFNDSLKIDENALMLSGAIGYRYEYFRAEVEYIWRDTAKDKSTDTAALPDGSTLTSTSSAEFDYDSYMFNIYYDFSPYTWFTPYISAGIGVTNLEYNFVYPNGSDSYDKSNFTWSLGAGVSAKMTNRFNIDVGYRYFDMGKMGKGEITNHEVYAGVRYVF